MSCTALFQSNPCSYSCDDGKDKHPAGNSLSYAALTSIHLSLSLREFGKGNTKERRDNFELRQVKAVTVSSVRSRLGYPRPKAP